MKRFASAALFVALSLALAACVLNPQPFPPQSTDNGGSAPDASIDSAPFNNGDACICDAGFGDASVPSADSGLNDAGVDAATDASPDGASDATSDAESDATGD